jgi:energy-coupling factor transporter transmembrane protein EcfT
MWQEKLRVLKTNRIQALYPAVKFYVVCLYSLCSVIIGTIRYNGYPVFLIPWFFILPVLAAASGIFRKFCRGIVKVLFLSALVFLVQCFLIKSSENLWHYGILTLSKPGLITGLVLGFSILNIAGVILWMFQITENKEISRALDDSGMNYQLTYMFMASLQMIKVLGRNSRIILNAQQARGVETEGNVFVRARAFFPVLVPLILGSVTGAEERVLTLESKGFDVKSAKTHIFSISRSPYDTLTVIISCCITAAVLAWRVLAWL